MQVKVSRSFVGNSRFAAKRIDVVPFVSFRQLIYTDIGQESGDARDSCGG